MRIAPVASLLRSSSASKFSPFSTVWLKSPSLHGISSLDHRTPFSGSYLTQLAGTTVISSGGFSRWRGRLVKADMAPAAVASAGLRNVFVYGSLLAEEVLTTLLKRVPRRVDAVVENFHRFSITDRVYPAALPCDGRTIAGKVLLDLADEELNILDEFESMDYIKMVVEPKLVGDVSLDKEATSLTGDCQAFIYVWEDATDKNLYGEWDYEEWRQDHLKDFLAMCEGFISELRSI